MDSCALPELLLLEASSLIVGICEGSEARVSYFAILVMSLPFSSILNGIFISFISSLRYIRLWIFFKMLFLFSFTNFKVHIEEQISKTNHKRIKKEKSNEGVDGYHTRC